jgi:hypothetical protein
MEAICSLETLVINFLFFKFLGWGESESIWYISHYLAYCTSPGWYKTVSVEQSVEWELAGKTKLLRENLLQCHFSTTNPTWPDVGSNLGCHGGRPATNRLNYGTAHWNTDIYLLYYKTSHPRSPHSCYHSVIGLEGLRKIMKNLCQDRWRPGWDLNLRPPKYEARVLPTQL